MRVDLGAGTLSYDVAGTPVGTLAANLKGRAVMPVFFLSGDGESSITVTGLRVSGSSSASSGGSGGGGGGGASYMTMDAAGPTSSPVFRSSGVDAPAVPLPAGRAAGGSAGGTPTPAPDATTPAVAAVVAFLTPLPGIAGYLHALLDQVCVCVGGGGMGGGSLDVAVCMCVLVRICSCCASLQCLTWLWLTGVRFYGCAVGSDGGRPEWRGHEGGARPGADERVGGASRAAACAPARRPPGGGSRVR